MLAQRLVRVLCPNCKTPHKPEEHYVRQVNVLREDTSNITFYRQSGCESCRYTGFKGRTALHEVVKMSEPLRRIIVGGASANEIKREAMLGGMRPIRWDGWDKIKQGVTTIEEVLRVTMEDEFNSENIAEVLKDDPELKSTLEADMKD